MERLEIFKHSERTEEDQWFYRLIKDGKTVQESRDPLPKENMRSFVENFKKEYPDLVISYLD